MTPTADTAVPRHLSEEERALWENASGPLADVAGFKSSVLRSLLTALSSEREAGTCGAVSVDVRCDRPRNHHGECCGVLLTPYTVVDGVTVSSVNTVTWSNPAALAASSTETPHA